MEELIIIFLRPLKGLFKTGQTLYGLVMPNDRIHNTNLKAYVEYLVGTEEWLAQGRKIEDEAKWWVLDGIWYDSHGTHVRNFCKEAQKKQNLKYITIKTNNKDYDGSDRFITDQKIWHDIIQLSDYLSKSGCPNPEEQTQNEDQERREQL